MEVILWIVLLGLAILVTALVVSLHYQRKYTPIFRQLSELLSNKDLSETDKTIEKPEKKTDSNTRKPIDETDNTIDNPINNAQKETAKTAKEGKTVDSADGELFKQLTEAIRKEQLYITPKFGRKELVERFHLTGKRVSTAFSMAGTSVPEFIRECRLEHARQLMVERPEMTLSEIAAASGFVHASTFTVDFKNKYGVSPTIYREKELRAKSNSEK